MPDRTMHAAHRQLAETIEKRATDAYPDEGTPAAVAKYVKTPRGRELANAASTLHQAARRG